MLEGLDMAKGNTCKKQTKVSWGQMGFLLFFIVLGETTCSRFTKLT